MSWVEKQLPKKKRDITRKFTYKMFFSTFITVIIIPPPFYGIALPLVFRNKFWQAEIWGLEKIRPRKGGSSLIFIQPPFSFIGEKKRGKRTRKYFQFFFCRHFLIFFSFPRRELFSFQLEIRSHWMDGFSIKRRFAYLWQPFDLKIVIKGLTLSINSASKSKRISMELLFAGFIKPAVDSLLPLQFSRRIFGAWFIKLGSSTIENCNHEIHFQ